MEHNLTPHQREHQALVGPADLTVDVPAVVRAEAAVTPGGDGWLRGLPGVVDDLVREWGITLTAVLPGGDGYVRVLRHAPEHTAVLLEALGPSLQLSGLPPVDQLGVLAGLLRRAWRVPPSPALGGPQDRVAGLAELVTDLWGRSDHPCDPAVVDHALACLARRSAAFDPASCVVVHGDAAAPNAARVLHPRPGAVDGFVLIDPVGFVGDPAYDAGVALRDWSAEVLAADSPVGLLRGYCDVLARGSGADPVAVWEWGYAERVSTGLYEFSLGVDGSAHLDSAALLLGAS